MKRTAPHRPHRLRLHATMLAIALLASSLVPAVQAAPAGADAAVPTSRARNTPVTLNFVNADIEAVSRAIGAMLNRDILVDPRVKGQITVYNDKPQPLSEAYRSYLAALRGLGFTVVESGGFLKVVPEADAKLQTGVVSVGTPAVRGDQVLTQIFKLNYENPNNLVAVLRPLISANNTINASPGNNTLVITDYADNLQRLGKIIAALDQPAGAEVEVVPLQNSVASDLQPTVQKLIDTTGTATAGPGGAATSASAGSTQVIVDSRTNSLILRASNAGRMAAARMIVEKLDQPARGGGPAGNIWVVYLKNADAVKLAEVLRAAIASGSVSANGSAGGAGGGARSGTGAGTSQFGGGNNANSTSQTSTSSSTTGSTASSQTTTPVSASAEPSTGGQVQADPATNSLIITASEPLYRQIRQVIDQLDVRRAQVYVESLMVTVDAERAAQYGFQWQSLFGQKGDSTISGGGTNFGSGLNNITNASAALLGGTAGVTSAVSTAITDGATSAVSNGLNIGVIRKFGAYYTLGALAQFLETNAGGNVLATPNLVALDNEEAKIVVGQNIPLVTGSYTNSTTTSSGTVNPFQTVERQDVGITLRIKSQIGENGTVRMTIYEENSSVSASNSQVTNKTSVETYVTVDDGSLVVLGGLMQDSFSDNTSAVPLLSNIPVIGNLFKSQSRDRHKQNLILFLRPIVIRTQADADKLTLDRYSAIREQQESLQPKADAVMRVNTGPVVPTLGPDGRLDSNVPQNPDTAAVALPTPAPAPDLHKPTPLPVPAPVPQQAPAASAPGAATTTSTTTTSTTAAPLPASSPSK